MIEAVVFDLDGVLVDSEPLWEQVRRQVVAEHGGQWARDAQQRLMSMSTGEWAKYLNQDLGVGLPPERIAELVIGRMQARYRDKVPLMPGAVQAVRRLAARWSLGMASSSPPVLIGSVLDNAGLRGSFAARDVNGAGPSWQASAGHLPRGSRSAGLRARALRGGGRFHQWAAFRRSRWIASDRGAASEIPA